MKYASTGAIVGVLLIAGCGGGTTTVVSTVTTSSTASTGSTSSVTNSPPAPPATPDCVELLSKDQEGPCLVKGFRLILAKRTSTLRLKTLSARIVGVRTADSVATGDGYISQAANGLFVIVTLAVTNRLDSPAEFDPIGGDQTQLLLGGNQYSESFDAENTADPHSFVTIAEAIQPGQTQTGDVIFDAPAKIAQLAVESNTKHGAILVANLGADVNSAKTGGVIRIGTGRGTT